MESLLKQKMSLQDDSYQSDMNRSQQTIQEVVGAYQNGGFQQPITRVYTSATGEISTGGQSIAQNQYTNHNINLNDQGVLYNLRQTMFTGLIELPINTGFPTSQTLLKSIRNVFATVSWKIGNLTSSTANHEYLSNILNTGADRKKLSKIGDGLLDYGLQQSHGSMANSSTTNSTTKVWQQLQNDNSAALVYLSQSQSVVGDFNQYIFGIPLSLLLDLQVPNDVLYCGLGQSIQIVLRNVQSTTCLMSGEFSNPADSVQTLGPSSAVGYKLSRLGLIKSYTKLDQNLEQKIHSVSLQMPIYRYFTFPIFKVSGTNISQFTVGKGDRIKRFLFSMNPVSSGQQITEVIANENIVTQRGANLQGYSTQHYPLQMVPAPIYQITINIGGMIQTIDLNQVQLYQRLVSSINGQKKLYQHALDQQMNYCCELDLTRFQNDISGSAGLESNVSVQIVISMRDDSTITTVYGQRTAWSSANPATGYCSLQAYQLQTFLEVENMKELKYGIYQ